MNKQKLFDNALKYHNITKKEFAQKSNIPYDTVTGWKRIEIKIPNAETQKVIEESRKGINIEDFSFDELERK